MKSQNKIHREFTEDKEFYKYLPFLQNLFKDKVELLPSVDELFELELAYLEYNCLKNGNLLDRLAYFKSVDNKPSKHFLMYGSSSNPLVDNRAASTRTYFENGLFSTGYATHGLFPYRGKFHPQLIKALINIIGVKKGETILDPMCGSGTANIEAALIGINSYAIDLSPFCQFMTKVKYSSLSIDIELLKGISDKVEQLFDFFNVDDIRKQLQKIKDAEKLKVYELALLAFLDSLGYSKRVTKSSHRQLFIKVLKRYEDTVVDFILNSSKYISDLGAVNILENATATKIPLKDNLIDGAITSPPYSFAIDYVKNDEAQLDFLGYNVNNIRNEMIGLVGKNKDERLKNYFDDMETVCAEVSRVLKKDRYFVMIIGSNTNQTGGIRLEGKIIESCERHDLRLVKSILKPIKGMRNTMKDEYILFFQKKGGAL
jgi:DNA modification methylase